MIKYVRLIVYHMLSEIVDIVDEQDVIVGEGLKSDCHAKGLWHRAASIFVFNSKGELLIQKRGPNVSYPNLYDTSASGHLKKGETYIQGAKRELKEELGLSTKLKLVGKIKMNPIYTKDMIDNEHLQLFVCQTDENIQIQAEELSSTMFIPIRKLEQMIHGNPEAFTPGFLQELKFYLKIKNGSSSFS
jgi:isopentenyl-diphosphate delta-isomerase